jgi:carbonic anhydrase
MARFPTIAFALVLLSSHARASEPAPSAGETAAAQQVVLQGLADGNARFVEGRQAPHDLGPDRRRELAKGQHPRAVVLSCSDSRVPPEHVFDQQLGEIFVVRTAGNVADGVALGSIEYAVEHLGTPVIVVLGHRSCGAVRAAVEVRRRHGSAHGNVAEVLRLVMPAVAQAERARAPDLVDASIDANVALEAKALVKRSPVIAGLVRSGKVRIVTAVYDLESGKVEFATAADPAARRPAPPP